MKIKYNAPIILTYSLIAIGITFFGISDAVTALLASPSRFSYANPIFYTKLVSYIVIHGGWNHLMGNLMMILLVGPLLEEKYGSGNLFTMVMITAVTTALLNAFFFSSVLIGGSGVAFMLILLSSFSNIRAGEIPLTFIVIAGLYIGGETMDMLKADNVSQFSHLAGGFLGACFGFLRS